MASRSTSLTIEVLTDASKATAGLSGVAGKVDDFAGGIGKKLAGVAIGAGILKFGSDAVKAASDAQQAAGGVGAVFKQQAGVIETAAKGAAKSIGLSTTAYETLATVLGSQLKTAGFADIAGKTQELIALGADLAAQFGGPTSDAVSAISSLMRGERDPIERYGVSINDLAIKAEIAALGLDTSTNSAQRLAVAQASLSLLTKQSADALGAAAREQDSAAARYQQFQATLENVEAAIGSALLPTLSALGDAAISLAPFVQSVGEAAANVLAMMLALPGPIQAAALAFGALFLLRNPLGSFMGAIGDFRKAMGERGGMIAATGGEISKFGLAAEEATARVKGAGSAIFDAFGGPPGIALASFIALATQLPGIIDKITDSIPDSDQSGVWVPETDFGNMIDGQRELEQKTKDAAAAAAEAEKAEAQRFVTMTNGERVLKVTASAQDLWTASLKSAQDAAQSAADSTDLAVALKASEQNAKDAGRALDGFRLAVEKVDGKSRTLAETQVDVGQALDNVRELFKTSDDGKKLGDALTVGAAALVDFNIATLSTTDAGRNVVSTLLSMKDAHVANYSAAYSDALALGDVASAQTAARDAARENYKALFDQIRGFVDSDEAARGLLQQLGILDGTEIDDKTFKTINDDAEAQKKLTDMQNAAIQNKIFDIIANDLASAGISKVKDIKIGDKVVTIQVDDTTVRTYKPDPVTGKLVLVASVDYSKITPMHFDATTGRLVPGAMMLPPTPIVPAPMPTGRGFTVGPATAGLSAMLAAGAVGADAPDIGVTVPLPISSFAVVGGAPSGSAQVVNVTYNLTVTGALDADATARQINALLRSRDRRALSITARRGMSV